VRILGIDPGSLVTGVGVVDFQGRDPHHVYHGLIRMKSSLDFPSRIEIIHRELRKLVEEYQPETAAIEKAFVSVNPASALKLGQVRGGVMLTCKILGLNSVELSPRGVKMSLTGYGAAAKEQVGTMVQKLLGLEGKLSFDESDALAIAISAGFTLTSRIAGQKRRNC